MDKPIIVYAEDNEDLREDIEALFGRQYDVRTFETGHEALTFIERSETPPALLISDYEMPGGMYGAQLIARAREAHRNLPAIGTTSTPEAMQEALASEGITDVPIIKKNAARWVGKLEEHIAAAIARSTEPEKSAEALPPAKPILFHVDDSREYRDSMVAAVGEEFNVKSFSDASEALEALATASEMPALIVTDGTIPEMDGAEFAKNVRSSHPDIPLICATNDKAMIQKRFAALSVEDVEIFSKTSDMYRLLREIRSHAALAQRETPDPSVDDANTTSHNAGEEVDLP